LKGALLSSTVSTNVSPDQTNSEPDFAAFVGIDWADQKHCWKLMVSGSRTSEVGQLINTPEQIEIWAAHLEQRFGGRPIAVAFEHGQGSLIYQLSKYPDLVLYPIHPKMAARYREAFSSAGPKSDPRDTGLALDLVLRQRDRLRRLEPDDEQTRLLQLLVEHRRRLVDEKTCESNRLTACLKNYFPQALEWIDDIDSLLGCAFLREWPSLQSLQCAKPGKLRKFFHQHNCRSEKRIDERIESIYHAIAAVNDRALLEGGRIIVSSSVSIIEVLLKRIAELDKEIEGAAAEHPDAYLFADVPGAGPALKPRLIAAFGHRRERYQSAEELLSYSGIAPVTVQSGKAKWVHFRYACPKFLRQTFHEVALHSLASSSWSRAHYDSQRAKGKGHHAAVRSVAYKLVRILFRCWKDRTPYCEEVYLKALEERHSPLARILSVPNTPPPTQLGWQSVAGFQKLSGEHS
jgi:transposase